MTVTKTCKDCGESFQQYNTTQSRCNGCTYLRYIQSVGSQKKRKPIRKYGKEAERWTKFRANWIKTHATSTGTWMCALRISPMCLGQLTIDTLTLDHKIPRSGAPELRYNESNVQPACLFCNNQKGSKRL